MNYVGLQDLKVQLSQIHKTSQNPDFVFEIELLNFYEEHSIRPEPYSQILYDLELLYIRFYMIREIISTHKKLPALDIKETTLFRLAFTHESNPYVLSQKKPFVYFINWLKPDLSEICYRFFYFDGSKEKDFVMHQSKNLQVFRDWYNLVYEDT